MEDYDDLLFVGLDVTDLTTVGALSRGSAPLKRAVAIRRHGSFASDGLSLRATLLLLALLASLLVLLEALFFLSDPVMREEKGLDSFIIQQQ